MALAGIVSLVGLGTPCWGQTEIEVEFTKVSRSFETPVPGAPGEQFNAYEIPSLDTGWVAFVAYGTGGVQGVYRWPADGPLEVVADRTAAVPGAPGDTFLHFEYPARPNALGQVVFSALTIPERLGVYASAADSTLRLVADDTFFVPGGPPGEQFAALAYQDWDSTEALFLGVGDVDSFGLYRERGSALSAIVDRETQVPGAPPGVTLLLVNSPRSRDGGVVFKAAAVGGIFTLIDDAVHLVANHSTQVPGAPPGTTFTGFAPQSLLPSISDGKVCFHGDYGIAGGSIPTAMVTSMSSRTRRRPCPQKKRHGADLTGSSTARSTTATLCSPASTESTARS